MLLLFFLLLIATASGGSMFPGRLEFERPEGCAIPSEEKRIARLYSSLSKFLTYRSETKKELYPESELGDRYARINKELILATKKPGAAKKKEGLILLADRIIRVLKSFNVSNDYVLGSTDDYLIILAFLLAPFKLLNSDDEARQIALKVLTGIDKMGGDLLDLTDFLAETYLCGSGRLLFKNFPQYNEQLLKELIASCKTNRCRCIDDQEVIRPFTGIDQTFLGNIIFEDGAAGSESALIENKPLADQLKEMGERGIEMMRKAGENVKEAIVYNAMKAKAKLEKAITNDKTDEFRAGNEEIEMSYLETIPTTPTENKSPIGKLKKRISSWDVRRRSLPPPTPEITVSEYVDSLQIYPSETVDSNNKFRRRVQSMNLDRKLRPLRSLRRKSL
jgi:hypothetical protein